MLDGVECHDEITSVFSDIGQFFDWEGVKNGVEPWASMIDFFPNSQTLYSGIMWVTDEGSWAIDLCLGLFYNYNDDLILVTHELRPEQYLPDGWRLNSLCAGNLM